MYHSVKRYILGTNPWRTILIQDETVQDRCLSGEAVENKKDEITKISYNFVIMFKDWFNDQ